MPSSTTSKLQCHCLAQRNISHQHVSTELHKDIFAQATNTKSKQHLRDLGKLVERQPLKVAVAEVLVSMMLTHLHAFWAKPMLDMHFWTHERLRRSYVFFFFCLGGKDIHYTSASLVFVIFELR